MRRVALSLPLVAVLLFAPQYANAQGAFGIEAVYDTEVEEVGVGGGVVFHTGGVVDSSRVAVNGRYFLTPESTTFLSFNVDGQYLFYKGVPVVTYGILGLNIAHSRASNSVISGNDTVLGFNLGAGAEYRLGEAVSAFGEGKLVISLGDIDPRFVLGGGVRFYFGGGGGGGIDLSDY